MAYTTLRTEDEGAVRHIVLTRPEKFNSITPELRDDLGAAIDEADDDRDIKVILLRAEGKSFCAGFGLDWSTFSQANDEETERAWDSVEDMRLIGSYANVFSKLHSCSKPTIAAVQGYCIAGGTDLAFNSDIIICSEDASFGYPPARVWGVPEQPWLWVARLGLQQARRYLFTGDEIPSEEAERLGLVLKRVPNDKLLEEARAFAQRVSLMPLNQLQMHKFVLNDVAHRAYDPRTSRAFGCLFDGVARHTEEGREFVEKAQESSWREVIRDRDRPYGDYGEKKRS